MSKPITSRDRLGQAPLLTPEEELLCGRAVQAMMSLLEFKPDGPYTRAERSILHRGRKARDRMITGNIKLVFIVARKYLPLAKSLTIDDLIQDGIVGLIRGVEKFDPSRGYKFSTYAYWWLRQGITRGLLMSDRMIRLPSNASDSLKKIWQLTDDYQMRLGRAPTLEEISDECNITAETVKLLLRHTSDAKSLDQKALSSGDELSGIGDLLPCDRPTPWDIVDQRDREEWLEVLLGKLNPSMRQIIDCHYGLEGREPNNYAQMAALSGFSPQYTRSQCRSAVDNLQRHAERLKL